MAKKSVDSTGDAVLQAVRKSRGEDSIMRLTGEKIEAVPVIPTGALSLDLALGVMGYPHGRIIEVYGPEASGKTTLTLHAIAEAQKQGGIAAFIDAEHALDPAYAKKIGVDTERLLFSQPDSGEQALNIVEDLVDTKNVALIVVDSVAALTPQAELEGDMGAYHVGVHSRLMSQAMRKLCGKVSSTGTVLIFINQIRMKIGVMFGSPETTTGGNALKFYASVRLDVRRISQIKSGEEAIGNRTRIKVLKNKHAPPFKETELDIIWGKGFDKNSDLLGMAITHGVVEKSGAWLSYNGERLAQGFANAAKVLEGDSDLFEEIHGRVMKKVCP